MSATELFEAGKLAEAVAAASEAVKKHPTDISRRGFLCELLCFTGELERADKQLDAMGQVDPQSMLGISLFRQLIRAETARREFYEQGRVPEFLDQPPPHMKTRLEASIRLREGHAEEAAEMLEEAVSQRPAVPGVCESEPFDDLRDLDDLTASFFEVLTSNGKYYWIPMERVQLIEFRAPERPRDLIWRRAHMVVSGGPDGEIFLPGLYAGSHAEEDDRIRLGRYTDWRGGGADVIRGIGQRTFLIGDQDRTIMELKEITFSGSDTEDGKSSS